MHRPTRLSGRQRHSVHRRRGGPDGRNNPSNGTVYDNGSVTLASSNAVAGTGGLETGTAQKPFSTLAANTLTITGVNTTGVYTYQVI
jgi:hypothetical protein